MLREGWLRRMKKGLVLYEAAKSAMVAKPANAFLLATSREVEFCDTAATSNDFCREEKSVVAGVLSPSAFLATETPSRCLLWGCD